MERQAQDRHTVPQSAVKLPLAPIVSPPLDRRGANATRRGTAIFSPTQTLDHHHHLRPPHVFKNPFPDPDPDAEGGQSNSRITASSSQPTPEASNNSFKYRECLKNHAASMGGHVVDGCGEFMPNGEEGTAEALRCAACDCHRNFHRKEEDGEPQPSQLFNSGRRRGLAAGMVSFGDESSSEDLGGGHADQAAMQASSRKRFRTKFSQQQKDRMQELAEKLGWRIQKQDEEQVQRLCNETGVKRQVFKVWMHNNKQAMKKRRIIN